MKKFFKKNYLVIPSVFVLIFLSVLFNSKYADFDSLASILSAQQLLTSNQSNYNSLTYDQKVSLIAKIDKESNALAVEYQNLFSELENLKKQKTALQSEYDVLNQKLVSVNSQTSTQNSRLEDLRNRLQNLNENYRAKNAQCNQLKGVPAQNCRAQLKNISDNINNVKTQITSTQNAINSIRSSSSTSQSDLSSKAAEIKIVSDQITAKQNELEKIKSMMNNLDRFRKDVTNSTNSQNDPNRPKPGCTDINATNWDSTATEDDGSCEYKGDKRGCTDPSASNYDSVATEDDGSCHYSTPCECETVVDPTTGEEKEVEKVMEITAHVTNFGGPNDPNMGYDEKLSVSGGYARNLNPNDLYIAWPMPDKENTDGTNADFEPPLGLTSVEKCFGPETNSWPKGEGDERIDAANQALKEYNAEISMVGPDGVKRTVIAKIVDRGPGDRGRFDVSKGVQRAVGIPQDGTYTFELKLVPKNPKKDGQSCKDSVTS